MTAYYLDAALGSDANAGTSPGAGNAWLTLAHAEANTAAGDTVWIKAGTSYVLTASVVLSVQGTSSSGTVLWRGYDATIGDDTGTRPVITSATNGLALVVPSGVYGRKFENLKFTHTAATRGYGFDAISGSAFTSLFVNCIFDGCASALKIDNLGAEYGGSAYLINCDVVNSTGFGVRCNGLTAINCRFSNNAGGGILSGDGYCTLVGNLIYANGGTGVYLYSGGDTILRGNTIRGNTGDGVWGVSNYDNFRGLIESNIFYDNSGYGVNIVAADDRGLTSRNNAYGANTSGARNNLTAGAGDVALSGDPHTNYAGGDLSLNNTAGAGASCRAAGFNTLAGGATVGYLDIGAAQHQDSGGGGSGNTINSRLVNA